MLVAALTALRRLEWKDWLAQAFTWNYAQVDALQRAAAAKGVGLDPAQFSRPFPGSTTITSVNASPAEAPPAPSPASPAPQPAGGLGTLAKLALGTSILLGGAGLGAGVLSWLRPTPQPVVAPAPQVTPAPTPVPDFTEKSWNLRIITP